MENKSRNSGKKRRGFRLTAWLSLFVLLGSSLCLSGCSTSIDSRKNDDSSTLYVGHVGTSFPSSFMPWLSRDGIAPTVASMLYSTLFSYDDEAGAFSPQLAKNWCYVDLMGNPLTVDGTFNGENDAEAVESYYSASSEDYMAVRVELFDNIYWSDGEKMTVEDVYYSFDVGTDHTLSNHAGALAWTADLKHESENGQLIKQGIFTAEHPDYSGTFAIQPGEEDTVMYLLVNKVLGAVTTLFSTILILPEHIWAPLVTETDQLNNKNPQGEFLYQYEHPVGCGAWILNVDETNTQVITLDRNENYHIKGKDGEPLYKVDRIKIMLYLDSNTAIFALRKGYVDLLDTTISSNYLSLMQQEEDIYAAQADGTSTTCLVLNVNPPETYRSGMKMILQNLEVREAIALAIDQEELIRYVLNGAGKEATAGLILSSNSILYNPEADFLSGEQEEKTARANALLDSLYPTKDEDGYRILEEDSLAGKKGERICFQILTASAQQDLVAYLQRQFQRIGIAVEFQASGSTPESTYLYPGNFDMTVQSVILSMSNADVMYKAHYVTKERSSNYGKFEEKETTDLIEQMRATLNEERKIELIKDIQKVTAEAYYKIPLYTADVLSVARTDRYIGYEAEAGQTVFNGDTLANLKKVK